MAINVPKVKPGDLITASYWNLVVDSLVSLQNQIDAIGPTGPPSASAPVITSVDPSPNTPVNQPMTIHGSNFAVPASLNTVTVNGTVLNDFQAGSTDQVLIVGVPGNLTGVPGTQSLVVATAAGGASEPFPVNFVAPTIVLTGQVALTNTSGAVGTIESGSPVLFQFELDGTAMNIPEQFKITATYENASNTESGLWDAATTYVGTSGSDHEVTVSPLSPVNFGISVVPPAGPGGGAVPSIDLVVRAVSVHNDPASTSMPQTVHIEVGSAPPAADPSMKITLGTNNRSTIHLNAAQDGLDIKYGATPPVSIDAVMGHQGSYQFVGAIDNPDTNVWQILDLPLTMQYADGQGQPVQFRLKLVPTTPPASPVARTFTLTATRQDNDEIGQISNFLSFPIDGFTA